MAETLELRIDGMTCADCALYVARALERAGARSVRVDWRAGKATLEGDGLGREALSAALAGTRYGVAGVSERSRRAPAARDLDLLVIGSGAAAFAAAIRARDFGRRVVLVERGTVGGTCVNVGCNPSKALLAASERARGSGLARAVAEKDALVARLRREKYLDLMGEYGFEVLSGAAKLAGPHSVEVGDEVLTADAILIATGASPAVPPIPGLTEAGYLTSQTAIELTEPPRRLAVIGANAIGLELGQMLANFGSLVTFVDVADRIAPFEEPEVSEALTAILEAAGHRVLTSARVEAVAVEGGDKVLRGDRDGEPFELRADELLVATGRRPNSDGLGLAEVGVETDARGAIVVDEHQRTSVESIFAAGDVTGQPQFVYVAAAGGAAAASNALGLAEEALDFDSLPRVTFTTPQIASAGLTEAQARERGFDVESSVLPLDAVPRALVDADTSGLFKLVAEAGTGRLVGASVLASRAGEVIQSAVLAIRAGMSVSELAAGWAPYLTMAEGLKLAAQAFGRDVAKLSCCAA